MSIAEKLTTIAQNEQTIYNNVNTETQLLDELQEIVDNLPEAGGGGSADTGVGSPQWWLDFTRNKKYFHYFFTTGVNENFLIETPAIDTSNGTHFNNMFENCRALEVVGGVLDFSNGAYFNSMFASCYALREIRFVPLSIKKTNALLHSSNLSAESIQSIIDGLADLTGATAQTLTFHATVGAKLTQAQKDAAAAKNWTLVY